MVIYQVTLPDGTKAEVWNFDGKWYLGVQSGDSKVIEDEDAARLIRDAVDTYEDDCAD
jgi:hypothetical protein